MLRQRQVLLLQKLQPQAVSWLDALGARLQGLPAGTAGALLLQCWLQDALASCCTRGASLWPCLCLLLALVVLAVGAYGRLPQKLCC